MHKNFKVFVGKPYSSYQPPGHVVVLGVDDSYGSLPSKDKMMFQWVQANVDPVTFTWILFVDDDVIVLKNRLHLLGAGQTATRSWIGRVRAGKAPVRDPAHKNFLPEAVFKPDILPDYVHGAAYALSHDLVVLLASDAHILTPGFDHADVSLAMTLAHHGVSPRHDPRFVFFSHHDGDDSSDSSGHRHSGRGSKDVACVDDAFVVGEASGKALEYVWRLAVLSPQTLCDALTPIRAATMEFQRASALQRTLTPTEGGASGLDEAAAGYRAAVALVPSADYSIALDAWSNLGEIYFQQTQPSRVAEAEDMYRRAIEVATLRAASSDHLGSASSSADAAVAASSHSNLAAVLLTAASSDPWRLQEAAAHFEKAFEFAPSHSAGGTRYMFHLATIREALANQHQQQSGDVLGAMDELGAAIDSYEKAIHIHVDGDGPAANGDDDGPAANGDGDGPAVPAEYFLKCGQAHLLAYQLMVGASMASMVRMRGVSSRVSTGQGWPSGAYTRVGALEQARIMYKSTVAALELQQAPTQQQLEEVRGVLRQIEEVLQKVIAAAANDEEEGASSSSRTQEGRGAQGFRAGATVESAKGGAEEGIEEEMEEEMELLTRVGAELAQTEAIRLYHLAESGEAAGGAVAADDIAG
jgi:tetratricopeptide (TPR) repeat protein